MCTNSSPPPFPFGRCSKAPQTDATISSLRLAARLFADHLLDRCHYLEWALSAFHAARMDMLPIWTVVLQIFWDEMVKHRKLGKPLSTSLLEKLDQVRAASSVRPQLLGRYHR